MIIGPTASGKSDLAVALALRLRNQQHIPAEIITADAFQIYKGLDIGTAKPTIEERRGVAHHLIDIVDAILPHSGPDVPSGHPAPSGRTAFPHSSTARGDTSSAKQSAAASPPHGQAGRLTHFPTAAPFTVDDWLRRARALIADLRAKGTLPIVVGGTALYIQSLTRGLFEGPPASPELRAQLAALPRETLRAELEAADPAAAQRIHPNDLRRTIRALEVFRLTGKPISEWQTQWEEEGSRQSAVGSRERAVAADGPPTAHCPLPTAFSLFILSWPTDLLNRRINARVKNMMERGLLDELRALLAHGNLHPQAAEALGYKQLLAHLASPRAFPLDDAIEKIKIETRRYAKNQRTWMKRLAMTPGAITLDASTLGQDEMLDRITRTLGL